MLRILFPNRFPMGEVVVTPGARMKLPRRQVLAALLRHASGDWGELSEEDREVNNDGVDKCGRLRSAYSARDGTRFWIITEPDRSVTTVLLPEEC